MKPHKKEETVTREWREKTATAQQERGRERQRVLHCQAAGNFVERPSVNPVCQRLTRICCHGHTRESATQARKRFRSGVFFICNSAGQKSFKLLCPYVHFFLLDFFIDVCVFLKVLAHCPLDACRTNHSFALKQEAYHAVLLLASLVERRRGG